FLSLLLTFSSFYCLGAHRYLPSFPTRRSSDLFQRCAGRLHFPLHELLRLLQRRIRHFEDQFVVHLKNHPARRQLVPQPSMDVDQDRKSTRLNSSHVKISYAVFCLKKKKNKKKT